jgi:CDP-diglyceride synthetase
MSNSKTVLGFITGAAAAAIIYVLAISPKSSAAGRNKAAWKENTTNSFTGWLEKLKLAVDKELKQEA